MSQVSMKIESETSLENHSNNGDELLKTLRGIWEPYCRKDIDVRHEMGMHLNGLLGSPTKRQTHGAKIILRVSTELQIDKSDICRMRRFAQQFKNLEAFRREHPEAISWTKVRTLLSAPRNCAHTDSKGKTLKSTLTRAIKNYFSHLQASSSLDGSLADELRSAILALITNAENAGIQFDSAR